ncbi:MAG: hypothetical protein ACI9L9_001835, partial [Marivirga sp.]
LFMEERFSIALEYNKSGSTDCRVFLPQPSLAGK